MKDDITGLEYPETKINNVAKNIYVDNIYSIKLSHNDQKEGGFPAIKLCLRTQDKQKFEIHMNGYTFIENFTPDLFKVMCDKVIKDIQKRKKELDKNL
tara:strand:- start:697 stop:990 length:294 start_codon:yes stop_codon:yes gene_type:complete